jgi:membrane protein DedA with SNARE-associated domain
MLESFLDWLARLPTLPTYLVLIVLSALENVFPPVPADVAVALGAFLARRGELSPTLLGVLCWLANTATAAGMYVLGRVKGEAFFEVGWGRRLMPPAVLEALREAYARHGAAGVFVSRFFPGVRAAVPPFAGIAGLSPARAILPAAAASAIWYAGLVIAGTALGLSWPEVRRFVEEVSTSLGLLGVLATAAVLLWIWRRSRRPRGN